MRSNYLLASSWLALGSLAFAQNVPSAGVGPGDSGGVRAALPGPADLAPRPFTEEAVARGVDYTVDQFGTFGCGAAFADLDGDGDPDLVLLGRISDDSAATVGIFENDGHGNFVDRTAMSTIPPANAASGISAGDFDGDGLPDLYVTLWLEPNMLLRNEGNFVFTNVAGEPGFETLADLGAGSGSCWGDVDGDGWLDLYVTNRTTTNHPDPPFTPDPTPNRLFLNQSGQGFVEVAGLLGVDAGLAPSFCASFFDFDQDGDVDLYLSNDKGASTGCAIQNVFWRNDGGTFVDISQSSKTDGCLDAMCVALGDFDGNLWTDIYVSNTPPGNALYLNQQGEGTFAESAALWGAASYQVGWGSLFFDYDNDGWQELYVCQHRPWEPNRFFVHGGAPPAVDRAFALGIADAGQSFVCAKADIDGDGDEDLLVSNRGERVKLFVNHEGQRRSWVAFDVVGAGPNRHAIGARVQATAAGHAALREVVAGSAFKSQDALTLGFGLDAAEVVDLAVAHWPLGTPGARSRQLTGYAAGTRWAFYPPVRLGDHDGDGVVDLADFQALVPCWDAAVVPGCEVFDLNGDAVIDLADWTLFAARYALALEDCNANGVPDLLDILNGTSFDLDADGVPDECGG